MERLKQHLFRLHPYLLAWIAGALTVAQIVLAFCIQSPKHQAIEWAGYVCWWTSAFFGWWPIVALLRRGGVPKGKSYVHTTQLVETDIYAIVRHPQMGTAWLLMCLGLMLLTQHWSSVALGLPAMILVHLDLLRADQRCVEKFGDAYRQYMGRVPRTNFVLGIIRLIMRRAAA